MHNGGEHKKLIAQNVVNVLPNATQSMDSFIPNIYQSAESVTLNDETYTIVVSDIKDLVTGDIVQITYDSAKMISVTLESVDQDTNSIDFILNDEDKHINLHESNNVFIFGKMVNDFLSVDYDHVMCLNISATQELHKQIVEKDAEIQALTDRLAAIETHLGL